MPFPRPTILMCPPDFYGIEYEINPWMSRSRASDSSEARRQWRALHELLVSLGVDVRLMAPVKGLPDLVFTANAGLIWHDKVFLSRFRHEARQGETPHDAEWFADAGFHTIELPPGMDFEGAGDALFCSKTLYAGYLIRSDARSMQWVASEIGCRVLPLQLVDDRYYHLDTCFCPLAPGEAIYYPPAFDRYARSSLRRYVDNLLPVSEEEAARFACNAVVVGKDVVLNTGCPQLEAELTQRGYTTHATPLDEFIKAGGSAKCLTLRLDGEDAALWE
ncbi:MAG: amidinotransferase [Planctomycetota bacterium]|nr:MAG: amidinotransferase [Planctomycetota bacterium]REK20930.1 MAG: amidinotransferase [Planctomycetota bacterium]REK37289.1 MAG: amidinotransferase [Planctomycetota bacterium]